MSETRRAAPFMGGDEILASIKLPEAAAAVERAFLAWADGDLGEPESLALRAASGTFHVKACASKTIFVAKTNANYPGNPARGLPTIQGVVAVFAVADGRLLVLLDSPAVTNLRTAATTITAIRHLAPADAREAAIIGCGALGRVHAQALRECLGYERLFFHDADTRRAQALAAWAGGALGIEPHACATIREASLASPVVITCTSSHRAFLDLDDVRPGALVAGVGADNPQKAELTAALLGASRNVDAGVRGELAAAIRRPRPVAANERVVFRSTGLAIEDLALATLLVEKRAIDCG